MMAPSGAAPRVLTLLVAAIVLAGLPPAVLGGYGRIGYAPYAGVGALLAIRRPPNPIGWLLIGFSWAFLFPFEPGPAKVAWLPALVGFTLPPIAIGIAILRYRLYDIDRIVSRTISYALVTAIVATVFGGAIVLMSAALGSFAQGQTIAVAASTLAAFAAFQPILHRVRRDVDRRFNRARYDAEQTVAGFSARLREEVDISTVTTDLRATVHGAVKPASLGLWIREAKT